MKQSLILCCLIFYPLISIAVDDTDTLSGEGILFSRIGYNLQAEKHIMIRGASENFLSNQAVFSITDTSGKEVMSGNPTYWGAKWKNHWWVVDFSKIEEEGTYICHVRDGNNLSLSTKPFEVQDNLLWDKTWKTVSITQLEGRIELRNRNIKNHGPEYAQGGGWQDCGSYLREVNSHSTMLVGLLDLLEHASDRIPSAEREEIISQIIIGMDYIAFCQDKARALGKGEGAIIHEWPKHTNVITGDVAKGALCFARAGHLLRKDQPDKAAEYLQRAERSFMWLDENGPIHHPGGTDFSGSVQPNDGFDRRAYGAPQGFVRPKEWKTRDIVMMTWIALELTKAGKEMYKEKAVAYAQRLMDRQIPIEKPEGRYYGHFKPYASADFSEKAWEHHHMGYDAGATFPHYLIPLIEMTRLWPDHPDAQKWDATIRSFAYGYFLPACFDNPFHLLPMGYFLNEGLLTFSGLWHGMNGAYGSAAALALELQKFTHDARFGKIATGNLQWIAGLNAGIRERDHYISKSMIYGIGDEYIGSWTKIPGTICNGFEADKQFVFTEPKASTDGPFVFTDEGWITHSGGWLSAISRLDD